MLFCSILTEGIAVYYIHTSSLLVGKNYIAQPMGSCYLSIYLFPQNLHQQITKCKILMAAHAMVDSARGPLIEETLTK